MALTIFETQLNRGISGLISTGGAPFTSLLWFQINAVVPIRINTITAGYYESKFGFSVPPITDLTTIFTRRGRVVVHSGNDDLRGVADTELWARYAPGSISGQNLISGIKYIDQIVPEKLVIPDLDLRIPQGDTVNIVLSPGYAPNDSNINTFFNHTGTLTVMGVKDEYSSEKPFPYVYR